MINDIGQEEYLENCETGIEFSCVIDISFLSNINNGFVNLFFALF